MKFEPDIHHLRKWFMVERYSGHGMQQTLDIADFIYKGKTYSEERKLRLNFYPARQHNFSIAVGPTFPLGLFKQSRTSLKRSD
jgi:hypothetical protein